MRIYSDPIEMYDEVGRDLWEMGIKVHPKTMQDKLIEDDLDYETLELRSYVYQINIKFNFIKVEEMVRHANGNVNYCLSEFTERICLGKINPGISYKYMNHIWDEYLHNGKFSYTYNERYSDQLELLVKTLKNDQNTRQAIMTVYDHHDDQNYAGGKQRIPCSLYYQFLIRENKLDCIYTMRSCDYLLHFPHDVYLTKKLMVLLFLLFQKQKTM